LTHVPCVREFVTAMKKFSEGALDTNLKKWEAVSLDKNYPKHFWQEDTLECPVDYTKMRKSDYAGDSGIHIDRCFTCGGFWIDGGEIARLWEYVQPDMTKDVMGRFFVREMNRTEREKAEFGKYASMITSAAHTPQLLVIFVFFLIFKLISETIVGYFRSQTKR